MSPILGDLPADLYHADIVDNRRPSLTASIAKLLCLASPRHAWTAHPRLNPDFERDTDPKYDLGTAAHAWLLEGRQAVHVVHAADWRTNAAKDARDEARLAGRIPLLAKDYDALERMVEAADYQLSVHEADPRPFTDGAAEQTLVWDETGVLCRARLDWSRDDRACIDDYKTTGRSANPESWSRTLFGMGYDVQAAFYLRGLAAVAGPAVAGMADFRFVVQETSAPYALSVISLSPAALQLADDKVAWAIDLWRRCMDQDDWPGYPTRVCYADAPPWEETRWLEKEAREAA